MKMYGSRAHEKSCCRWCHPWGSREKGQIKAEEEREWRREAAEELECGFCSGRTNIPEPMACDFCYHLVNEPDMLNLDEVGLTPVQLREVRRLTSVCGRGHKDCAVCNDEFDW